MTIQDYITDINKEHKTGRATEHSYRGYLQHLIKSIAKDVMVTNEPQRVKCGAPDYIITKNDIPVGYIEAKDVGYKLDDKQYKEQFDRYRKSLNNLIITDYLDFWLYIDGVFIKSVKIAEVSGKEIKPLTEEDKFLNDRSNDDIGGYYEAFYEREEKMLDELQKWQRYSICLSIFSFFEGLLKEICGNIELNNNFKLKIKDLNGKDDIMKYYNFLVKIYEIDSSQIEPLLTPIRNLKIIRNKIAHQNGTISESEKISINQVKGIRLDNIGGQYIIKIIDTIFLKNLIKTMEIFFSALIKTIDKRFKEISLNEK
jgi:hypothetical protein